MLLTEGVETKALVFESKTKACPTSARESSGELLRCNNRNENLKLCHLLSRKVMVRGAPGRLQPRATTGCVASGWRTTRRSPGSECWISRT